MGASLYGVAFAAAGWHSFSSWRVVAQETADALRSLKRDLALCAIMSAGNDYLPSVPGGGLSAREGKPSLWGTYLGLLAGKQGWRHGCAAQPHMGHLPTASLCPRYPLCSQRTQQRAGISVMSGTKSLRHVSLEGS